MQPNQFVAQRKALVQAGPLFDPKPSTAQARSGQPLADPIEAAVHALVDDLRGVPDTVTDKDEPRSPSPGTLVRVELGDGPPRVGGA